MFCQAAKREVPELVEALEPIRAASTTDERVGKLGDGKILALIQQFLAAHANL
jgi:hypothetical protein